MDITAQSAITVDWDSNKVLWQKNVDHQQSIASLTKLMTVLVWKDFNIDWNQEITIQETDYREGGRFYLFKGEKIFIKDLLKSVLIASDNNAAVALARSTGISLEDFVVRMNSKATELGMENSFFADPTGLDARNQSTVSDLVVLANKVLSDEDIFKIVGTKQISYGIINNDRHNEVRSTNLLLDSYLNIIAGKTGFSDEAGGCLLTIAVGDEGQKVLVIVLGSEDRYSRFQDAKALLQWTFDNFKWPKLN